MSPDKKEKNPYWLVLLKSSAPLLIIFLTALLLHFVIAPGIGFFPAKMMVNVGIAIIMAVSLNVVNGYTGQFSIGHAGFMAVGGYSAGCVTYYGSLAIWGDTIPPIGMLNAGNALFVFSLFVGGAVAGIFGYLVGLPSLRLRGDYLAIVTLGFGEIIRIILQRSRPVLQTQAQLQETPLVEIPTRLGGAVGFHGIPWYNNMFWTSLFAMLIVLACYRIKASIQGRAFLSIRENEIAAEAMGVPTTKYKVKAFVLAAFFAGIGGGLYAHETGVLLNPRELGFQRSLDFVVMVVLGGMGSISGSVIAAIALTLLPELLRNLSWVPFLPEALHDISAYRMVIYALLLIFVMLVRPQGLFGIKEFWELEVVEKMKRKFWRKADG